MTRETHISDEALTAYLDQQADPDEVARIEAALSDDPSLTARMAALDIDLGLLHAAGTEAAPPPPTMPVLPPQQQARAWRISGFATGLVAGAALVLIGMFLRPAPPPKPEGWASVVANYQMLYTPQTLANLSPTPSQTAQQLGAVATALDLDVTQLPEVAGLTFKRAQMLGFDGRPLAQISFEGTGGVPVALCILATPGAADAVISQANVRGLPVVRWTRNGFGYLLIGDADPAPLLKAAEVFSATL